MTSHEGGCLCGRVRFRVAAPALDSGYCHCRMCQKNSGAPVVAWASFPATGFSWLGEEPSSYASSSHGRRKFCSHCGSYLVFASTNYPHEVSVNTASFDDPGAFAPRKHIYAGSRIAWFHTDDDLPSHPDYGDPQPVQDGQG
jgi:hypothetical protein